MSLWLAVSYVLLHILEIDNGDGCEETSVCVDSNAECVSGQCQCNDGYTLINGTCTICKLSVFVKTLQKYWLK